ncbi:DUF6316 family protein [Thiohalophilus thiocyanatoxydans]|uniref:DUF6316 domain-containing protein n=1 Tax=Thiohalophilus thiocyanatoxydans TaxID=381308 RepID=A0A4R8IMK1_9GAMM|nr:DUF6316 family protein [Thiohalophilus thiocyanatoxydans]TDX97765.1 hypothetical protein EDC23_2797 [Thiohalophilus thiocyanatoxydans]
MHSNRRGEQGNVPFRSGRFFNIDSNWYFSCREGGDQGPFDSRDDAEAALTLYIRDINTLDQRLYN